MQRTITFTALASFQSPVFNLVPRPLYNYIQLHRQPCGIEIMFVYYSFVLQIMFLKETQLLPELSESELGLLPSRFSHISLGILMQIY